MDSLHQLGQRVPLPQSPELAVLESIPFTGSFIIARFQIPEFTSCCPVTAAPDFGRIIIDYCPNQLLVESKSLKLFAGSFRSYGCFHEKIVEIFSSRIWEVVQPHWLRVSAFFAARGGIPIDVFCVKGVLPDQSLYLPPLDLNPYLGR